MAFTSLAFLALVGAALAVYSLKACHQHNPAAIQLCTDSFLIDPADSGIGMDIGGKNTHLPCRQRNHRQTHFFQRHSAKGNGNLLTHRKEHIHFPFGAMVVDLICFSD